MFGRWHVCVVYWLTVCLVQVVGLALWLYLVFLWAACRWPTADMPQLVAKHAHKLFDVKGNMLTYSICRGSTAKNSNKGSSIIRGNSRAAFLKPTLFVSPTKSLLRSLLGN